MFIVIVIDVNTVEPRRMKKAGTCAVRTTVGDYLLLMLVMEPVKMLTEKATASPS